MNIYPPIRGRNFQSYDSVVLIPAFNEDPTTIAEAIDAVERQHGLGEIKVAVILIINNARNAAEEIIAMNEYARNEIQSENARRRWPKLQQHLFIVDAFTGENAPEICNVGVASRLAAEIALKLSKLTGIFHRTDADSTMGLGFIEATHRIMKLHPEVAGVTGPLHFVGSSEEIMRQQIFYAQESCKILIGKTYHDWEIAPSMPGSNMSIRRNDYVRTGGFKDIAGAEDTMLSYELLRLWKKIVSDPGVSVTTSLRLSDRTDPLCGQGQTMIGIAPFIEAPENAPTWSPEQRSWYSHYYNYLLAITPEKTADERIKILSEIVIDFPCDYREVLELALEFSSLPMSYHPLENALFVKKLRELTEARYQQIPLLQAVPLLRQQLLDDEHLSEPIETVLQMLDPNRLIGKFSDKFQEIQAMIVDIETALAADVYCSDIQYALELLPSNPLVQNDIQQLQKILLFFHTNIPKMIALYRSLQTFPISKDQMCVDIPYETMICTMEMHENYIHFQNLIERISASSQEECAEMVKFLRVCLSMISGLFCLDFFEKENSVES